MDSKLWPLTLKPKDDELLSSWMLRIAHNHHQKVYTFFKAYIDNSEKDKSKIWTIDLDRNPRSDIISLMSIHTGLSIETVEQTTLKYFEGRLFESIVPNGNSRWILPQGHYHTKTKRHNLLYCPSCLTKDSIPYFRKSWKLSSSFLCLECNLILRETCGECGSGVNFIRSELGKKNELNHNQMTLCHNCFADLRNAKSLSGREDDYKLQFKFSQYMKFGCTDSLNYSHLFFDALYQVCGIILSTRPRAYQLQLRLAQECGVSFKPILDSGQNSFDYLETRIRLDVLKMANFLLEEWPERFIYLMEDTRSGLSVQFLNSSDKNKLPFWYTKYSYSPGPF